MTPLSLLYTLALGAFGGWVFDLLNLPLAWMMGSMAAVTLGCFAGLKLWMYPRLRFVMIGVLGVMLGSRFSPAVLDSLPHWLAPIGVMVLFILLAAFIGRWVFEHLLGWDRATAYFSAMPGGLAEMVLGGEQMGGHGPTISLMHSIRIMMAVFTIPFYFRFFEGVTRSGLPPVAFGAVEPSQYGLLLGCLLLGLGYAVKGKPRIPAGTLILPMFLAAGFSLSGVMTASPPALLVQVAQVVLGSAIGARFQGVKFYQVAKVMAVGVAWTGFLLTLVVVLVWLFRDWAHTDAYALFLALSPGGLAEMSLMALALHLEAAFVSGMHVLRVAIVVLSAPLLFKLLGKEQETAEGAD